MMTSPYPAVDTKESPRVHMIIPAGLEDDEDIFNPPTPGAGAAAKTDNDLALDIMDMHVLRNTIIELRALRFQLDKLLSVGLEDFRTIPREEVVNRLDKLADELEDSPEMQGQWEKELLENLEDDDESKVKMKKDACKEDMKLLIKTARDGMLERLLEMNIDPTSGNVKEFKMEVEKLIQSKMNRLMAMACCK